MPAGTGRWCSIDDGREDGWRVNSLGSEFGIVSLFRELDLSLVHGMIIYMCTYMTVLRACFMAWCTTWYSYIAPSPCVHGAHARTTSVFVYFTEFLL